MKLNWDKKLSTERFCLLFSSVASLAAAVVETTNRTRTEIIKFRSCACKSKDEKISQLKSHLDPHGVEPTPARVQLKTLHDPSLLYNPVPCLTK